MKKSIIRDLLILVAIGAAIWAIFALVPFAPKESKIISINKEYELGEFMVENFFNDAQYSEFNSETVDSALSLIAETLSEGAIKKEYTYKIIVFDHTMINAFAMPGGNIIISTGLLNFIEEPEELAAIMAHEMGHIENRDVLKRLIKNLGIAVITSGDQYVLSEVSKTAVSTVFDRKQEREADEFALKLLEASKINPRIYATVFRRFNEANQDWNENLELLMTHPHNNSRIRAALEYELHEDFSETKLDIDWQKIKNEL